jgi:hypothetical protein|tara:strand:+ start:1561 stop:1938 length:378 start_codon:yes stop_codon:yes gene_type:complete
MSKQYKIVRPKPCIVDEATRKLELQPVGTIIDANSDLMKANMERFESMGWAIELKMDSPEETIEVEAEVKEVKRARNDEGHLVGDDKSTPDVNEAWEGGEAPVKPKKKTAVKKTTKKKTTKKASD